MIKSFMNNVTHNVTHKLVNNIVKHIYYFCMVSDYQKNINYSRIINTPRVINTPGYFQIYKNLCFYCGYHLLLDAE